MTAAIGQRFSPIGSGITANLSQHVYQSVSLTTHTLCV